MISTDLGQIVCFHKSRLFKLEQEIRLLFDNRKKKLLSATSYSFNNEITSPILKSDISKPLKAQNEIKYLELIRKQEL